MAYDTTPDAEYIHKFARRKKSEWANQAEQEDRRSLDLYLKRQSLDVAVPTGEKNQPLIKTVGSGLFGLGIDQDIALLSVGLSFHVTPPTLDDRDQRKASELFEPWLNGMWRLAQQADAVWARQLQDLRLLGRGWSNFYPLPQLWSAKSNEYRELVDAFLAIVEGEDEAATREARAAIAAYKRDNFPLRWRYVDVRSCWPELSDERRLPEVVEIRQLSPKRIVTEYGEDAIPRDIDPESTSPISVYEYANWSYTATVVGSEEDPRFARKPWEHGLKMSPYVLLESEVLPPNDEGLRWKGAGRHVKDIIESIDEILSDWRTNHRNNTIRGRVIKLNPEMSGAADPTLAGRPQQIDLEPGKDLTVWSNEEVGLLPVPEINEQSPLLLDRLVDLAERALISPILRGETKSGQSAVSQSVGAQLAQQELNPAEFALTKGAQDVALLALASVEALSREYPGAPDEVFVVSTERGQIGISPSDIKGWKNRAMIEARLQGGIPMSRNAQVQAALGLMQLGLPDDVIYEELKYENPQQLAEDKFRQQVRNALLQFAVQNVAQYAGQLLRSAPQGDLEGLGARIAGLPQAFQQVLGAVVPGNVRQGQANMRRAGTPQGMSELQAQEMMGTGTAGGMPVA